MYRKLIEYLSSENFSKDNKIEKKFFDVKSQNLINIVQTQAPVKTIAKNKNEQEILTIFNEIVDEIKKIDLKNKIEFLEAKVSMNLDEKLYSELLSLRNQLKEG